MPETIRRHLTELVREIERVLAKVDPVAMDRLIDALMSADRIFLYGQGRTGHMTRAFANRLMHVGMRAHFVGETTTPPISNRDLCLVNSGTGKTRFVYHVAAVAKEAGAKLATITAHPDAPIGRMADLVVTVPAITKGQLHRPTDSCQPPGSLFEQAALLLMDGMVLSLMERLALTSEALAKRHANIE